MSTPSVSWLNLLGSWGWARPSDILLTVQITASRNISCVDKGAKRPLWIMSIVASATMDDTKTYLNCGYQFRSIFVSFYSTKGHDYVHLLWIISVDFSEQLRYGTFLNLWKNNSHVSVCCSVRYILDWAGLRITMTWQWARWRIKSPASRLFTQLFIQAQSKNTSKLLVTGFCEGNSPVTGEFPPQRASNAENVSAWWRHHGCHIPQSGYPSFLGFHAEYRISPKISKDPFYLHGLHLIPASIGNHMAKTMWDELIHSLTSTVQPCELMNKFISLLTTDMITYPCRDKIIEYKAC